MSTPRRLPFTWTSTNPSLTENDVVGMIAPYAYNSASLQGVTALSFDYMYENRDYVAFQNSSDLIDLRFPHLIFKDKGYLSIGNLPNLTSF